MESWRIRNWLRLTTRSIVNQQKKRKRKIERLGNWPSIKAGNLRSRLRVKSRNSMGSLTELKGKGWKGKELTKNEDRKGNEERIRDRQGEGLTN